MYRVELKGYFITVAAPSSLQYVPNVPCGVESRDITNFGHGMERVPNVPCGVESHPAKPEGIFTLRKVPNAPCGVESVELKE